MKKFFDKTKEKLQEANNRIAAQVAGVKYEEEPEYKEASEHLDQVHEKFAKMNESINQVNSIFKENQKVFTKLPEVLNASIAEENHVDYSKVTAACEKVNSTLYKKYVSEPLGEQIKESQRLKELREKRINARIQYESSNKILSERKAKNKDTPEQTQKLEKELEEKKTKYENLNKEFLEGATKLYESRNETVKKVYAGFTYYYTHVNNLINEQLESTCKTYNITVNDGDYEAITGE